MIKLIHVALAPPTIYIRDCRGKRWAFENNKYCGPVILKKDHDPMAIQPSVKSPFWAAYQSWVDGGRKMNGSECDVRKPQ